MSHVYSLEPATQGKVILVTTVGDIEIELWPKETPKACRNFVQLCLEKYYDDTIFHRVIKDFIIQAGDPTGTGTIVAFNLYINLFFNYLRRRGRGIHLRRIFPN